MSELVLDIERMPNFNVAALTTDEAREQVRSVTRGRVYFGLPPSGRGLETVCCLDHGATLCVATNDSGKLWRCPACNEGAFVPARRENA